MYNGNDLRVLLLGKTGVGKSSLGNTLLGTNVFGVARGLCNGTVYHETQGRFRCGVYLQVTDTPGLCSDLGDERHVIGQIQDSLSNFYAGPHVVLMVVRSDTRFTQEQYDVYCTLKAQLGNHVCKFMVIAFTGADALGDTREKQRLAIQQEIRKGPPQLNQMLNEVGGYLFISNRTPFWTREQEIASIINGLKNLVAERGGGHFQKYPFNLLQQRTRYYR